MSNILLWGAGNTARRFIRMLDLNQNIILGIIDNDSVKWGGFCNFTAQYPIISPEDISNFTYDALIVCSLSEQEILWQCHILGLENIFSCHDKEEILEKCPTLFLNPSIVIENEKQHRISLLNQDLIREQLWCNIFHDTVLTYKWYNIKSLSLGRTAIGYNYAYVMSRILQSLNPLNILEFGLGQSSKIINAYFQYYKKTGITYDLVEHNPSWIDFFKSEIDMEDVNIHVRGISIHEEYNDRFYMYDELESVLTDRKYNFISIDGPFGYTGKQIGRIDLLEYIPDLLDDDWVIMMDDYERITEKNAIMLIEKKLQDANIVYHRGMYRGEKHVCVLASEKWEFFGTL